MSDLTPEREAELERCREAERNLWRIAEKCGDTVHEAAKVWGMLRVEAKFLCADFMGGQAIALHGKLWIERKNPFHIDAAVMLCGKYGCPILPSLVPLVKEVARRRLLGEHLAGTVDQILREGAYDRAFRLMAWLRAADASISQASVKAAHWLGQTPYPLKASVLARKYSATYRARHDGWPSIEEEMIQVWNAPEHEAHREAWEEAVWALPDASEDRIGSRR
jgi:hypothetical protein